MQSINIFTEVVDELKKKLNEQQLAELSDAYESLERAIKFSRLDIMSIPNLDDFIFPVTISAFKALLNNIKDYATTAKNKEVIKKAEDVLQLLPNDEATAAVQTEYYNTLQESYDSIPVHDNKLRRTSESEPNIDNLIKIVSDFIMMNGINKDIEKEIDYILKYFASRISDNEQGSRILSDREYSYMLSLEKLAAYLNLNTGSKIDMDNPEIDVKGNRALLEISLYNAFLAAIIKIISYWKHKIFDNYLKIPGDNLPTDFRKKIDAYIKSSAQYDYMYKAASIVVSRIINDKLTKFVMSMKEYQDSKKTNVKVSLTEPEALALEELFVTRLNKNAPVKYLKQWV